MIVPESYSLDSSVERMFKEQLDQSENWQIYLRHILYVVSQQGVPFIIPIHVPQLMNHLWENSFFLLFNFFSFLEIKIDIYYYVSLKCATCWFDTLTCRNMITIIVLANISITSRNYHFFFVLKTCQNYSFSNFQVYNRALLTTTTMLCIRLPQLTHFLWLEVCTL